MLLYFKLNAHISTFLVRFFPFGEILYYRKDSVITVFSWFLCYMLTRHDLNFFFFLKIDRNYWKSVDYAWRQNVNELLWFGHCKMQIISQWFFSPFPPSYKMVCDKQGRGGEVSEDEDCDGDLEVWECIRTPTSSVRIWMCHQKWCVSVQSFLVLILLREQAFWKHAFPQHWQQIGQTKLTENEELCFKMLDWFCVKFLNWVLFVQC